MTTPRFPRREHDRMINATNPSPNRTGDPDRRVKRFPGGAQLESFSQKASDFVSGPWGTITLFGLLSSWVIIVPFIGWSRAYKTIDEFITVASFILLFLLQ